jgi:hypothetical protein
VLKNERAIEREKQRNMKLLIICVQHNNTINVETTIEPAVVKKRQCIRMHGSARERKTGFFLSYGISLSLSLSLSSEKNEKRIKKILLKQIKCENMSES